MTHVPGFGVFQVGEEIFLGLTLNLYELWTKAVGLATRLSKKLDLSAFKQQISPTDYRCSGHFHVFLSTQVLAHLLGNHESFFPSQVHVWSVVLQRSDQDKHG